MASPVLITTAISPPSGVHVLHMTSSAKRIITCKGGIFFFAASGADRIVVADATGQLVLSAKEVSLLHNMGVIVEQITYVQDNNEILAKGKGYAEGKLMKFAIENSNILRDAPRFYKCTGKMYCRNFFILEQQLNPSSDYNMFWTSPATNDSADTRFFLTSKKFWLDHLLPAYETCNDFENRTAEGVALALVREKLLPGNTTRPLLAGFSGSCDSAYVDHGLGHYDYHAHCFHGHV